MAIPIFWRLILSHTGVLLLSGASCLYSIVQLGSLSGTARSALDTNRLTIGYHEALTDAFLSQIRYGGKYLITHTEGRHEQSRQFKKEFVHYLNMLKDLERSESTRASLARIERSHQQYHELFDRETAYIRANQNYAQTRYQQEREKIVEGTLNELDGLKAQLRTKLQQKLESIDSAARTARRIAIVTSLVVLILGTILALKVSRAIGATGSLPAPTPAFIRDLWTQALRTTGAGLSARLSNGPKLLMNCLSVIALSVSAAWSRRFAMLKNASPRKGS